MKMQFETDADCAVLWGLFLVGVMAGAGVLAFILLLSGVFDPVELVDKALAANVPEQ